MPGTIPCLAIKARQVQSQTQNHTHTHTHTWQHYLYSLSLHSNGRGRVDNKKDVLGDRLTKKKINQGTEI